MNIMNPPKMRMTTPAGRPAMAGGFRNIGAMKFGAMTNRIAGETDRQAGNDVAGQALLCGQGPDLALDPDALTDGVGDRVEDLGEVAADLVLDADGGGHQFEVVRADAADHVLEGLVEREAEVDLADDPSELDRHRGPRLAHDKFDGLEERRPCAQRVGDQRDRVRKLLVERVQSTALAPVEPEAGDEEADEAADQQEQGVPEGGQDRREQQHPEGDADDRPAPDQQELRRLEAQVGSSDVAREVRPEVATFDDLVEVGQRLALREQFGDAALTGLGRAGCLRLAGAGVALEAIGDARSTRCRDADCDQDDRKCSHTRDRERHGIHGSVLLPAP